MTERRKRDRDLAQRFDRAQPKVGYYFDSKGRLRHGVPEEPRVKKGQKR